MAEPEGRVRDLYEAHEEQVERVLTSICRRNRWLRDEAEDFRQWARLRLIENDRALLRAHAGRARFTTYLTVVLHNLMCDYRNRRFGRWRPSAAARRLGDLGIRLDTLLHRDGRSLDDATEILRRNHGVAISATALAEIAATLPPHLPRRFEDAAAVERLAAPDRTDRRWLDGERLARARRARSALDRALASLAPEDGLLVKLRYLEGLSVARIARRLDLEQKPLYRRIERLLGVLRRQLAAAGLTATELAGMLGQDPAAVAPPADTRPGMRAGPSTPGSPA